MKNNILMTIVVFFGLYIFSTGVSFAFFNVFLAPSSTQSTTAGGPDTSTETTKESKFKPLLDTSGPKTEVCPLNNLKYTEEERKAWEERRPLLVMVENHEEARPQSGLSSADIVYETVAEGGITRFMGIYYCDAQSHEIIVGPVRSARTYFLDWASEYGNNPLYAHVGGANCHPESGAGCGISTGGAVAKAMT